METVSHRPQDTFHGIKAPLQQRRRHIRALNRQPEYQPQQRAEQQPAGEASGQHPIGSHRARTTRPAISSARRTHRLAIASDACSEPP